MSQSWVNYALLMSSEELGITEEERELFLKEKNQFCIIGDKMVKEEINPKANANDLFEKFPPEQRLDFIRDALQKGFEYFGLRKKKMNEEYERMAEDQGQRLFHNR